MSEPSFRTLVKQARACTLCAGDLKDGVRPVFQVHPGAKVLIAGQAPGSRVHASGIPFDDPSGERLRDWMGVDRETFYDETQIAILPMAFCYPGKGKSGDLPPMPICADTWREALLKAMPHITVTLVIGQYAQAWHLPAQKSTLTETVRDWEAYDAGLIPLPHPSPRNNIWLKRNAWFEKEVVPVVRKKIMQALK
jgi:uracil-DNA glycosylase